MRPAPERIRLTGAPVDPLTMEELEEQIAAAIGDRRRLIVGHQNLHGLYLWPRAAAMRRFAELADRVFIDGMALVALARGLGHPVTRAHRVTYADWIDPLMAVCAREGWRVVHVGGRPGVGERAASELRRRHPGLSIDSTPGYLDADQSRRIVDRIADDPPQLLLVGMGMPRQEAWVVDHADRLPAIVVLTCGACMDYVAGAIATPPRWLGRWGLEWLYRLASEPRRLAARYLWEPWPVLLRYLRRWRRERRR